MTTFLGKNGLTAKEMFDEKGFYNGYVLTELANVDDLQLETIQIKDFLQNEKMLTGRIDALGNTIVVNPANLSPFGSQIGGNNSGALNFVVDSFNDMKEKFENDLRTGLINFDSEALSSLEPRRAYEDPIQAYKKHQIDKKQQFLNYVEANNLLSKIVDFDSFARIYMDFVSLTAIEQPFTSAMFLLTTNNSILSTGLAVEIYEGKYDDDQMKVDLFYKDPNFEYLKNLAYSHGFVIDKHVPWRLVADLGSPNLAPYVARALPPTITNGLAVLNLMYARVSYDDLSEIIGMMVDTYNTIVAARPFETVREPTATMSNRTPKTVFTKCKREKTIIRTALEAEKVLELPSSFWVDKYIKIKNFETGISYSPAMIGQITRNAFDLINSVDTTAGMRYINSKFNGVAHFEGSMFYDYTRLQMSDSPRDPNYSVEDKVQQSVQASNFVVY